MSIRSQHTLVGVTTNIRAEQRRNIRATPTRGKILFFSPKNLGPILGPTHPATQFAVGSSFTKVTAAGA